MKPNSKGEALTVVLIVVILLAIISATLMTLGYNQRKLQKSAGSGQAAAYYRTRGGVVEAFWRIRSNYQDNYTVAGTTKNYSLDVDGDGTNDTTINIGARDAIQAGLRQITASSNT